MTAPSTPRLRASSLFLAFLGPPSLWVLHLSVSYFLVTLDCTTTWDGGALAVVVATILFAAATVVLGWRAWRTWRMHRDAAETDPFDSEGIGTFLMLGGALLAVPFTIMIVLAGIAPFFAPMCV